jgi:MtN3 and saliva related transmembrane protein
MPHQDATVRHHEGVIIGLLAGILTTACWVPQVIKSLRTRKVDEFSWLYLVAGFVGIGLWFVYGLIRRDHEIWLANGLTDLAVLALILLKLMTATRSREPVAWLSEISPSQAREAATS